jgi:hypothetical protein
LGEQKSVANTGSITLRKKKERERERERERDRMTTRTATRPPNPPLVNQQPPVHSTPIHWKLVDDSIVDEPQLS